MAWHFGRYVEALAAAGKAVKPLPMYANAWLGPQPGQPEAGDYPSGGPASRVLEVWKCAAPSLDFLSPDIYVDDVKAAIAPYDRPDNPLFVPESRVATGNVFWTLGLGAFGFSAFGIDDIRAGQPPRRGVRRPRRHDRRDHRRASGRTHRRGPPRGG